jgi:glycosyltransferase involved in cell wall biosynthesis
VDHVKIPVLLREHNLYLSSALSDTTSVSLLEAMACGLFPVVTNIPANREWISDGVNGSLFSPSDPADLARVVVEAWKQARLRKSAQQHNLALVAEKANWRDNMAQVKELFERLIKEKSR